MTGGWDPAVAVPWRCAGLDPEEVRHRTREGWLRLDTSDVWRLWTKQFRFVGFAILRHWVYCHFWHSWGNFAFPNEIPSSEHRVQCNPYPICTTHCLFYNVYIWLSSPSGYDSKRLTPLSWLHGHFKLKDRAFLQMFPSFNSGIYWLSMILYSNDDFLKCSIGQRTIPTMFPLYYHLYSQCILDNSP